MASSCPGRNSSKPNTSFRTSRFESCFRCGNAMWTGDVLSNGVTLPNLPQPSPQSDEKGASMKIRIAGLSAAIAAAVVALVWFTDRGVSQPAASPGASVDSAAIANADARAGEWLAPGRTYSEQRFSPLNQINTANVKSLGVAWEYRTYSVRGLEATPIVADGTMFITLPWSIVIALDAA